MRWQNGIEELTSALDEAGFAWSFVSICDDGKEEYAISDIFMPSSDEKIHIITAPENTYKDDMMQASACIAEFCVKAGIIGKGKQMMIIGSGDADGKIKLCENTYIVYDGQGLFDHDAKLDPLSFSWEHGILRWTRGFDGLGREIEGELREYRKYIACEYKKYRIAERFSNKLTLWMPLDQYKRVHDDLMRFGFGKIEQEDLPLPDFDASDLSPDAKWLFEHVRFDGFTSSLDQCPEVGKLSLEASFDVIDLISSYANAYGFSVDRGMDEDLEKALDSGMAEALETLLLGVPLEDILA